MKKHFFKSCLLAVFVALFAWACSDDDDDFNGIDNFITEFQLTAGDAVYPGAVVSDTVFFVLDYETDLKGAAASYALSENATITPDPKAITDWNTDQRLTVTSKNGSTRTYYVKVKRVPGPDSYIIGFGLTIGEETYQGAIVKNTITITVPGKADLTRATAQVELSAKATITPDPASITDWSQKQVFTVKTDTASRTFEVNVERQPIVYIGSFIPKSAKDIDDFLAAGYTHVKGNVVLTGCDEQAYKTKESMIIEVSGEVRASNGLGSFFKNLNYAGAIKNVSSQEEIPNLEIVGSLRISEESEGEGTFEFPKLKECDEMYAENGGNYTYIFPELKIIRHVSKLNGIFDFKNIEYIPTIEHVNKIKIKENCEIGELWLYGGEDLDKLPPVKKVTSVIFAWAMPNHVERLKQFHVSNLKFSSPESGEYDFSSFDMLSSLEIMNGKNIDLKLPLSLERLRLGLGSGENTVSGIENVTGTCELDKSWCSVLSCLKKVGCLEFGEGGMEIDLSGLNSINDLTIPDPLSLNWGKITTIPGKLTIKGTDNMENNLSFLKGITLVGTLEMQSKCMDYSDLVELAKNIYDAYPDDAPLRWNVKHPQSYRYIAPTFDDMISGDPERYKTKSKW